METNFTSEANQSPERDWLRLSQNPYAYHALFPDQGGEDSQRSGNLPQVRQTGVTAEYFEKEARRVLRQYEPLNTGSKLRPEFREFIEMNRKKTPLTRQAILSALLQYDLGPDLQPHLNRERTDAVVSKLREITSRFTDASETGSHQ